MLQHLECDIAVGSRPAHSIRDSGKTALKVRMYGCNLYLQAVTNWGLGKWGRPCTGLRIATQLFYIRAETKSGGGSFIAALVSSLLRFERCHDFHHMDVIVLYVPGSGSRFITPRQLGRIVDAVTRGTGVVHLGDAAIGACIAG